MPDIVPPALTRAVRTLPRRTQVLIVLGIALIIAAVVGIRSFVDHFASAASHSDTAKMAQTKARGTFRSTTTQWASLKVAAVQTMTFRTELVTDGKITLNNDRMTDASLFTLFPTCNQNLCQPWRYSPTRYTDFGYRSLGVCAGSERPRQLRRLSYAAINKLHPL